MTLVCINSFITKSTTLNGGSLLDIIDFIKNRHSVRRFSSRKLDETVIEKVLTAGQFAPSPLNSQPWHFTLIQNKTTLKNIASNAKHANFVSNAPLLIVVSINEKIEIDEWLIEHQQHIYSGATAMQNMWLAACSLALGCCWVTLDEAKTKHMISLPNSHRLIGGLVLGYAEESDIGKNNNHERKALSLLTSFEIYGVNETCETECCHTCLKMIPKSAACSPEGEDYIRYYCGLDCYTQWKKITEKWLNN